MKESVTTALGWIKAHQELLSLINMKPNLRKTAVLEELKGYLGLDKYDLNIHFPAAAIPKDGPSAGITITIALVRWKEFSLWFVNIFFNYTFFSFFSKIFFHSFYSTLSL